MKKRILKRGRIRMIFSSKKKTTESKVNNQVKKKYKIANKVIDSANCINNTRQPKPGFPTIYLLAFIIVFIIVVVTAFCIESISEKAVGFLSNFITIVITIIIFFYTINNEKREDYKLAKKNAAILAQSLNSIMTQITLINNGERFSVIYPSEILDYYRQCSVYLKYEYLEPIMSELSFVNRINACIERNDEEQAQRLIEHRRKCLSRWNDDFNIIEVSSNLRAFSLEQDEQKPWKEQKQYKEFDEFILSNYEKRIKKLTVKRLKEMDGKCEESVMADYIAEQLSKEIEKKNPELTKPLYEKRALTKAIYKIYLTLEEDEDGFKMCWGILSLSKE